MIFPIIIQRCSFLILILLSFSLGLFAQNRESLEKNRMEIIEQIDKTSRVLKETSRNKDATLDDLEIIKSQIENREKVIDIINESVNHSLNQITKKEKKRDELELKQLELQGDYQRLIQMSYRKLLTENKIVYFLSSNDWEQSLKRIRYTQIMEKYLQRKLEEIKANEVEMKSTIDEITEEHSFQKRLLTEEKTNFAKLEKDEDLKDKILYRLEGDEKRLQGALISKKREREELNKAIEAMIFASLKAKKESNAGHAAEDKLITELSAHFVQNKNQLPWPVIGGVIVSKYGKQKHPSLENVYISNNGIDILAGSNAKVKSVFKGEVVGAMQIPGNNYMLIIRHGHYYSVYSKLMEIYLSKGDAVVAGQSIGRLGEISDATLHFEIWKDKTKVNPEDWLR